MNTIAVFGDSISYGLGCDTSWVALLKKHLNKEVYNLSECGDTTGDVLHRFIEQANAVEPDIIIFAVGINDSQQFSQHRGMNYATSLKQFEENICELIIQAREFTKNIVFVGLTSVDEKKMKTHFTNAEIKIYNDAIENICHHSAVGFISLTGVLEKKDLFDGLHPNAAGHRKIFEKIKEFFDMYL